MALSLATVGGKVTAAIVNAIINVLTPGTSYTPTITNWTTPTTPPTTTGRYWRFGNVALVLVQTKLGTGAAAVSNVTISTPLTMETTGMITESTFLLSQVDMKDVSVANTQFGGVVQYVDATTVRVMRQSASNPGQLLALSSTTPFSWATLDELSVFFVIPLP